MIFTFIGRKKIVFMNIRIKYSMYVNKASIYFTDIHLYRAQGNYFNENRTKMLYVRK